MKNFAHGLLALLLIMGQAPAWAMRCGRASASEQEALRCIRVCAHSHALLTQHGKFSSVAEKACGGVQVSEGQAALAPQSLAPMQTLHPGLLLAQAPLIDLAQGAQSQILGRGPPLARPSQTRLSLPLAQAPPAAPLSV